MKIKAYEIQPGMVISKMIGDLENISLITALSSRTVKTISFAHFGFQDSFGGQMVGTYKTNQKVKVIKGVKRQQIIKKILEDVWRWQLSAERDVEMIRLIQAMDKGE